MKKNILLIVILCIGAFLRIHNISQTMPFIGDQGWFYLSARDMLLTGNIPLVGIPSSHPWLHQGPLWTYILAFVLWIGNFNPVSGAYLTAFFGILAVVVIYKIGSEFFSSRFGLMASLVYASSPLIVFHARMPYHTSPIPFFVLVLFYSLIKFVRGNPYYFPMAVFCMSILYNLHLGTVIFWPIIIFLIFYGYIKKTMFFKKIANAKIFIISLLALVVPMIPVFIYDLNHGFTQTLRYGAWFGYKFLQLLGAVEKSSLDNSSFIDTFRFFFAKYEALTVMAGMPLAIVIFSLSFVISLVEFRKNKVIAPFNIIFLFTSVAIISFFISNVASEAYLPMLFPGLIFIFIFAIGKLFGKMSPMLILFIAFFNISALISTNYLMYDGLALNKRIEAVKKILEFANGREYNLIGKGEGSRFESFTMNYEYLTWWLGNEPSKKDEKLKLLIWEDDRGIQVKKQ